MKKILTLTLIMIMCFIVNVKAENIGSKVTNIENSNPSIISKIKCSKLKIKKNETIKCKVKAENNNITWKSTDEKILKVTKKGKVTGKNKGEAMIKATISKGNTSVTVSKRIKVK